MKTKKYVETYVSVDIESDGPIPGRNSMISLGSAAFNDEGQMIGTYEANLKPLPEATQDPDTMTWWARQEEAWKYATENPRDPEKVMEEYYGWLTELPGRRVFVAYQASFDFMFVYWYLVAFVGDCPLGFAALDIKTYAMALLGTPFGRTVKRTMPKRWFKNAPPHSHKAIEDAIGQGILFHNMRMDKAPTE